MPSSRTPTPPIAVSAKEAARLLSISLSKLYELMRNDDVQSYVDGCSRRVTMSSIHGYVERRLAESGNGWRQITAQPRRRQQTSQHELHE